MLFPLFLAPSPSFESYPHAPSTHSAASEPAALETESHVAGPLVFVDALLCCPRAVHLAAQVRLRFFELVGKRCVDLICETRGAELRLMNDGKDAVRPHGASEPLVESADHLLRLLRLGKKRRATAATDVNGGSSRSHAVCQLIIERKEERGEDDDDKWGAERGRGSGLLTLVDCAGSERKEDSMYHSR